MICMLYGTLVRFYIPVLKYDDLQEMREDLIELLTSLTVSGDLSKLILQLCRVVTKDEEDALAIKIQELKLLKPEMIGISTLFTLDDSSKLLEMMEKPKIPVESSGDVGGSKILVDEDNDYSISKKRTSSAGH